MIRLAEHNDIESIIVLWNEAFPDTEENIRFFIDNRFVPHNTVVCEEGGEVVSMLFLLDGNLIIEGNSYSSYYLYAACTAESFRGRGIMAKLLEKAKKLTAERNKYFICLMPAEKSLFGFYERFGYKSIFSRKILNINSSEVENTVSENNRIDQIDYACLRNSAFKEFNRFEWDHNAIEFAFKHHDLYGGDSVFSCKGYALYNTNESTNVKELAFHPSDFKAAIKMILSESGTQECSVTLPADYPADIGKAEIIKSAMALPVKKEYEIIIDGIENAYLGLTLD